MTPLIVSDLHLNDNPRDEYRWALFPFLQEQVRKHSADALFILGDLTEEKDRHSARLVNRIVDALHMEGPNGNLLPVWILMGNHDNVDPSLPFFQFVNRLSHVKFISTPFLTEMGRHSVKTLFLPHTRHAQEEWSRLDFMHEAELVFMHGTVNGAKAENGQVLDGVPASALAGLNKKARVYSGDVHVPQKVGRVEYVGAPYPVRFGDSFKGRALLLKDLKATDIPVPSIRRSVICATPNGVDHPGGISEGDQVKIRIRLSPSEMGDWSKIKAAALEWCARVGVEVCGVELEREAAKEAAPKALRALRKSPGEVFAEYCAKAKVDRELVAVGKHILGTVKSQ